VFDFLLTGNHHSMLQRLWATKRAGKQAPRPRRRKDGGTAAAPATPDPTPMPSLGGAEAPLD